MSKTLTSRERRDLHEWRRCIYCGRYISYEDLNKAKSYNFTSVQALEPADDCFAHEECAEIQVKKLVKS